MNRKVKNKLHVLLDLHGLRVKNDGERTNREFALDITHLAVRASDCIFVLADRCHGKSALKASLKTLCSHPLTKGNDLDIPQHGESKPPVHVDSLFRAETVSFHEQDGDPVGLEKIKGPTTIIYCDDPLFPHTQDSSSREMIDIARARSLTMMITGDPDRIRNTLKPIVSNPISRILWLLNGKVFWTGSVGEFCSSIEILCHQYRKESKEESDTGSFLEKINSAIQKLPD